MRGMENNLGETILLGTDEISTPDLKKNQFWGLYFSASWCPPCRQFTNKLIQFYSQMKLERKFELILVTSDENERDFLRYYSKMPWLAIPWNQKIVLGQMIRLCRPQTIPHLCIFDSDGHYVTCDATDQIMRHGEKAWSLWEQIASEKQKQRSG